MSALSPVLQRLSFPASKLNTTAEGKYLLVLLKVFFRVIQSSSNSDKRLPHTGVQQEGSRPARNRQQPKSARLLTACHIASARRSLPTVCSTSQLSGTLERAPARHKECQQRPEECESPGSRVPAGNHALLPEGREPFGDGLVDSREASTSLEAQASHRVVNFYYLVDIPRPHQARLAVAALLWRAVPMLHHDVIIRLRSESSPFERYVSVASLQAQPPPQCSPSIQYPI